MVLHMKTHGVFAAFLLVSLVCHVHADNVNGGVSDVRVAVPCNASRSIRLAAGEFTKYWELVTGCRPSLVEAVEPPAAAVSIGFPVADAAFEGKTDAYVLRSMENGGLVLAGKNARSLFYAVYDFFERRCGCRCP